MVGRTISHYEILDKLGEGGMGVVYKARDTHLDRFVAIKVLPPERVADPERKRRFVQEAKTASALNHPNIITIHDIDHADGVEFIAMEYLAGKTLGHLIPRKGMPLSQALKCAVEISDALAKAHAAGVVHRDLKPGNVMVTEDGLVKVLDFGLAKLTEPAVQAEDQPTRTLKPQTEEGTVVGTVAYMSPEQAEGKPVDTRSDIFSFGAVLYEMITGRRPFQGDSRLSVMAAIVRDEPQKPSALAPSIPPELERVITRCLRKDPAWRWQSMADVKVALAEIKQESESGSGVPVIVPRRRAWLWPAGLIALALVAVGVAWLRFALFRAEPPASAPRIVPLTSFSGLEGSPAFSPDGKQVAFAWNGEKGDNFDIYVKLIDAGTPLRLTRDPAVEWSPAWSPDGRQIAFLRRSASEWEILVVSALGGPERKLGTAGFLPGAPAGRWLSWSPGGRLLAVPDRSSPQDPASIFLLSLETGKKRSITAPPRGSHGDFTPVFSPHGGTLAFVRTPATEVADIHLVRLTVDGMPEGEPRRLTFDNRAIRGLDWLPDGRGIVFSSARAGTPSLWRIETEAARPAPERVTLAGDNATLPTISRSAPGAPGRLAYAQQVVDSNIWRMGKGSAPARFISSTREDHYPQFSPDGRRIAFESSRSGNDEIWLCDSEGSNPVQLTFLGPTAKTAHPRWSPDGRYIAFDSSPQGVRDIYVVGVEGGGSPRRLTSDASEDSRPSWSRDGKWIYFGSSRTGEYQVWKAPAEGGAALQVTKNGGNEAFESFDSRFVYYSKLSGGIWRVPAQGAPQGGEEVQVLAAGAQGFWALARQGIYYRNLKATPGPAIEFFSFSTGRSAPVAVFPKGVRFTTGLAVSPDASWILYSQVDKVEADLMLVEGFR